MVTIPRRVWLAFIVAPIAALGVLTVAGTVGTGATAAQAWHGGFFFGLLGLPVAYVIEALVAFPLYARYAPRGGLPPAVVVGIATLAGAVAMPLVSAALFGGPFERTTAVIGAAMGAAAGATFVLVAGRAVRRTAI